MDTPTHFRSLPGRPAASASWQPALAAAPLSPAARTRFATEIGRFLRYCEILEAAATPRHARTYLARIPVPPARPVARQALQWFFQTARTGQ